MFFHGRKKPFVEEFNEDEERFLNKFRGIDIPILILDERWLAIFPDNYKTERIKELEKKIREGFKEQAKLSSKLQQEEEKKKKLMERIIHHMNVAQVDDAEAAKQEKSQEYIREINEKIEQLEYEFEQMPQQLKAWNEQLLIESLRICYRKINSNREEAKTQNIIIMDAERTLDEAIWEKERLQKENQRMYTYMHRLFGKKVLEVFEELDEETEGDNT